MAYAGAGGIVWVGRSPAPGLSLMAPCRLMACGMLLAELLEQKNVMARDRCLVRRSYLDARERRQRLRETCRQLWPKAFDLGPRALPHYKQKIMATFKDVEVIGSVGAGVDLPTSDVDLLVVFSVKWSKALWEDLFAATMLDHMEFALKRLGQGDDFKKQAAKTGLEIRRKELGDEHGIVSMTQEAVVLSCDADGLDLDVEFGIDLRPIFYDKERRLPPLLVDSKYVSWNAVRSSWIRSQPANLRNAVRVLKAWVKGRKEPPRGYCLTLLTLAVAQERDAVEGSTEDILQAMAEFLTGLRCTEVSVRWPSFSIDESADGGYVVAATGKISMIESASDVIIVVKDPFVPSSDVMRWNFTTCFGSLAKY